MILTILFHFFNEHLGKALLLQEPSEIATNQALVSPSKNKLQDTPWLLTTLLTFNPNDCQQQKKGTEIQFKLIQSDVRQRSEKLECTDLLTSSSSSNALVFEAIKTATSFWLLHSPFHATSIYLTNLPLQPCFTLKNVKSPILVAP